MEGFRPVLRRAVWPRLACVVLALATVLGRQRRHAWTTKVAGEVGEYDDAPLVARDPAGDLLAADLGYLASAKVRFERGAVLWRRFAATTRRMTVDRSRSLEVMRRSGSPRGRRREAWRRRHAVAAGRGRFGPAFIRRRCSWTAMATRCSWRRRRRGGGDHR